MWLDDMLKSLKQEIDEARALVAQHQRALDKLLAQCEAVEHVEVVQVNETATCTTCGVSTGWYCPTSPNKTCCYSVDEDFCDYCGSPDERK